MGASVSPTVVALAFACASVLMVYAGVAKRQLSWRPDAVLKPRPRKPRARKKTETELHD
jgi:hypothetical protein